MRRWLRRLLLLTLLAGLWVVAGLPRSPGPPEEGSLRIVAANVLYLRSEAEAVSAALTALAPDVLVLVELTAKNVDLAHLERAGYRALAWRPYEGSRGAALLVGPRLVGPGLEGEAEILEPPWESPCRAYLVVARLRTPAPLAVIGAHTPPPVERCGGTSGSGAALATLASFVREGRMTRALGPAQAGDPVVIAGDLNALPFQPQLWPLWRAGLADALLFGTLRPAPTWPAARHGLALGRIDAVWGPSAWEIAGAGSFLIPGSDHHGVYADLRAGAP